MHGMDLNKAIQAMAKDAKQAARVLRVAKRAEKDAALEIHGKANSL